MRNASPHQDRSPCLEVETLVVGGGITGAAFFHVAARRGRDVLLVERGDFASGSTQASGMMVWGGLLYLRNLEVAAVRGFCRARDTLLERMPHLVGVRRFEYLPLRRGGRSSRWVWAGLQVYRALSGFRRASVRPGRPTDSERGLPPGRFARGWTYEEGFLRVSDARYALEWLRTSGRFERAWNHAVVDEIRWDGGSRRFVAKLSDALDGSVRVVSARQVVNCAGPWTETVNDLAGIRTRNRHHPSQGVYLILPRGADDQALVMEMEHRGDALCWVPWGPVAMWGPTETDLSHPDQAAVRPQDVDFLLERLNRNSGRVWTRDDILNVRLGVRPLALPEGRKVEYSLDLSRRAVLESDAGIPWHTAFGGKLSGALEFAVRMHRRIHGDKIRLSGLDLPGPLPRRSTRGYFGGMPMVDPAWSRDHEACRTLEDYLRRRTDAAQWIACGGLGREGEHMADLERIALLLHRGDLSAARADLSGYVERQNAIRRSWSHG